MSEKPNTQIPEITTAKEFIAQKLAEAGFAAFEEFSAVDSLIHSDKQIGFYSLKECTSNASCLHHSSSSRFTQTDCVFEIKLMGTSSDYADFLTFDDSCQELYMDLINVGEFMIRSAELGRVYQSMPLKRLARELKLTLRLCVKESFDPKSESCEFHRAVLGGGIVIYPHTLDISAKARNVTISTVDGRLVITPVSPELAKITIKGRFTQDDKAYYFKLAEELSGSHGISLVLDGVTYKGVTPYECTAQVKDGELLGEYVFLMGGRAHEV